jgi:hypothetical protein
MAVISVFELKIVAEIIGGRSVTWDSHRAWGLTERLRVTVQPVVEYMLGQYQQNY